MSKRKRGARQAKARPAADEGGKTTHSPRDSAAAPPRRNIPLLVISVLLLVVWFAYLGYMAWKVTVTSQ